MDPIVNFIIQWNNVWKYDYWYRNKYGIAFNSSEHRGLSPIDIKFQYEEDRIFSRERVHYKKQRENLEEFEKTGNWLKYREPENMDELFDALDISKL